MVALLGVDRRYIAFRASGKLHAQDVSQMARTIEENTAHAPTVRVLLQLVDFEGWTLGGAAEAAVANVRDGKRVEKLVIVGERKSDAGIAWAIEVFGSTIVEFFPEDQANEAWSWLHADDTGEYLSFASFI
ncbi:MAG TPA: STAS/SEC14 domain-containing protein [Fimbriimonadaceae bacterium]|nr:STAS/SEC14 domain-containing protein [Fimbriimonadaceae bacterium]HRJ97483.1 STAS/SEC14 domain-containing protein [Fimbriimonadaceae bacterium]